MKIYECHVSEESKKQIAEAEARIEKELSLCDSLNPWYHIKRMHMKTFGETWSENYIASHVPNLKTERYIYEERVGKNGKKVIKQKKEKKKGFDVYGNHFEKLEIKSSRSSIEDDWTMNQLHLNEANAFIFAWYNADECYGEYALMTSDQIRNELEITEQHARNETVVNIKGTKENIAVMKKYLISSWEDLNERV